jgi:hypothetical protein
MTPLASTATSPAPPREDRKRPGAFCAEKFRDNLDLLICDQRWRATAVQNGMDTCVDSATCR